MVSLNGEEDVAREYMSSTGMTSSLYESTVWEELTGYESVSTISILAKAQEKNVDILLISSANINTEIEKLNTDETTKQSVINAVNSGMIVTIPAEEITMGQWHGTGYIVTNPATGAREYIISGGLNGGISCDPIDAGFLVSEMYLSWTLVSAVESLVAIVEILSYTFIYGSMGGILVAMGGVLRLLKSVIEACKHLTNIMQLYYDYILDDSDENARRFLEEMMEIFNLNSIFNSMENLGIETLKWIYIWYINGGSIY